MKACVPEAVLDAGRAPATTTGGTLTLRARGGADWLPALASAALCRTVWG